MRFSDSGDFFEKNFNAAGDRDGDNSAKQTESIDTDDDGGEDDGGRETLGLALEFGGDEIIFDLGVDDVENKESDGGDGGAKEDDK